MLGAPAKTSTGSSETIRTPVRSAEPPDGDNTRSTSPLCSVAVIDSPAASAGIPGPPAAVLPVM
jgi:hypothetical protein